MSSLASLALDTPFALLGGRVVVYLPAFAQSQPETEHVGGIMGFTRTRRRLDHAGFDLPELRVRVAAYDDRRLDDGRLTDHLRLLSQDLEFAPADVVPIVVGRHLAIVQRVPPLAGEGGACPVCRSYLVHDDGSIILLRYLINAPAVERLGLPAVQQFFWRLSQGVYPGPRRLERGPCSWDVPMPGWARGVRLVGSLGPDVFAATDVGADYLVHRLSRLVPLGVGDDLHMMLYLGQHPSPQLRNDAPTEDLSMLGRPQRFGRIDAHDEQGRPFHQLETVVRISAGSGLLAHVLLEYSSPTERAILVDMLASLRVVDEAAQVGAPTQGAAPAAAPSGDDRLRVRLKKEPPRKVHIDGAEVPVVWPRALRPVGGGLVAQIFLREAEALRTVPDEACGDVDRLLVQACDATCAAEQRSVDLVHVERLPPLRVVRGAAPYVTACALKPCELLAQAGEPAAVAALVAVPTPELVLVYLLPDTQPDHLAAVAGVLAPLAKRHYSQHPEGISEQLFLARAERPYHLEPWSPSPDAAEQLDVTGAASAAPSRASATPAASSTAALNFDVSYSSQSAALYFHRGLLLDWLAQQPGAGFAAQRAQWLAEHEAGGPEHAALLQRVTSELGALGVAAGPPPRAVAEYLTWNMDLTIRVGQLPAKPISIKSLRSIGQELGRLSTSLKMLECHATLLGLAPPSADLLRQLEQFRAYFVDALDSAASPATLLFASRGFAGLLGEWKALREALTSFHRDHLAAMPQGDPRAAAAAAARGLGGIQRLRDAIAAASEALAPG